MYGRNGVAKTLETGRAMDAHRGNSSISSSVLMCAWARLPRTTHGLMIAYVFSNVVPIGTPWFHAKTIPRLSGLVALTPGGMSGEEMGDAPRLSLFKSCSGNAVLRRKPSPALASSLSFHRPVAGTGANGRRGICPTSPSIPYGTSQTGQASS
jgi:hypothetical protein